MSSVLSLPPTPPAIEQQQGQPAAQQSYMFPTMGLQALTRNPQLPQHPLGAYTDSLYEASVAQLRQDIQTQYNDLLQQLGYTNDAGQFVPGTVEIDANRQRQELQRNEALAGEQVTQQHQQQGTLFSGLRGTNLARAQYPFESGLADLNVNVPRSLQSLYEKASGLMNQFNTQHNLLLAEAAARRAQDIANQPASPPPADTGGGGTTNELPPSTQTSPGAPTAYDPNLPYEQQPTSVQDAIDLGYPIQPDGSVLMSDVTQPEPIPPNSTFGNGVSMGEGGGPSVFNTPPVTTNANPPSGIAAVPDELFYGTPTSDLGDRALASATQGYAQPAPAPATPAAPPLSPNMALQLANAPAPAPTLTGEDAYLAAYPDVAAAVRAGQFANGYAHYLQYGQNEGRQWIGAPGMSTAPAYTPPPPPAYTPPPPTPTPPPVYQPGQIVQPGKAYAY